MPDSNIVQDVLTTKRDDSRPTLEMSIEDMNAASDQPEDDTSFDGYDASMFDEATLIELHMDKFDEASDSWFRAVDGEEASWDTQTETVSIDLTRDWTAWTGQYRFEWALAYDDAPTVADSTDVDTVPYEGFFGMVVTRPTRRDLQEEDAPDGVVGHLTVDNGATITGDVDVAGDVSADNLNANSGVTSATVDTGAVTADSADVAGPVDATDFGLPSGYTIDEAADADDAGATDDLVIRDTAGNVALRYDDDADAWTLGNLNAGALTSDVDAGGNDITNGGTTDWEWANNIRHISSDVADVGAAVNDAIAELAPVGGQIVLPVEGTISTQIDLSEGVNGQELDTPLLIRGQASKGVEGTLTNALDATALDDHVFFTADSRRNLWLRDFGLRLDSSTADGINIQNNRPGKIENISVQGGRRGFTFTNCFGMTGQQLRAYGNSVGFYLDTCNASHFQSVVARENTSTANPAVEIADTFGAQFAGLYSESNFHEAIHVNGGRGNRFESVYMENNNRGGNGTHGFRLECGFSHLGPSHIHTPNLDWSGYDLYVDGPCNTVVSMHGDVDTQVNDGKNNTFIGCYLDNVDSGSVWGRACWINCRVLRDDTRSDQDIIIGQFRHAGVKFPLEDLTARDGEHDSEYATHDGSGTPSRSLCEWRSGSAEWYNYVDGSTF